jgi:hypothetical protein
MLLKMVDIQLKKNLQNNTYIYIQQYLVDLDPNFDAFVNHLKILSLISKEKIFYF